MFKRKPKVNPRRFLIFGKPRSRTAWASNLFTLPPHSWCLHEALADTAGSTIDLAGRMDRIAARTGSPVGNCDTGMIHQAEEIVQQFPDARFVLLTSEGTSWRHFCVDNRIPDRAIEMVESDFEKTRKLLFGSAHVFDVAHFNLPRATRDLWQWCLGPDVPFDNYRHGQLLDLNIQIHDDSVERRVSPFLKRIGLQ